MCIHKYAHTFLRSCDQDMLVFVGSLASGSQLGSYLLSTALLSGVKPKEIDAIFYRVIHITTHILLKIYNQQIIHTLSICIWHIGNAYKCTWALSLNVFGKFKFYLTQRFPLKTLLLLAVQPSYVHIFIYIHMYVLCRQVRKISKYNNYSIESIEYVSCIPCGYLWWSAYRKN